MKKVRLRKNGGGESERRAVRRFRPHRVRFVDGDELRRSPGPTQKHMQAAWQRQKHGWSSWNEIVFPSTGTTRQHVTPPR